MNDIEAVKQINKIRKKLKEDLGRHPLPEEIATEIGMDVADVRILSEFEIEEDDTQTDFQLRFKLTIKNHELEKARIALNLKQEEVGIKLGKSGAWYSQVECCRKFPGIHDQERISKLFGKSTESLFPSWLEMYSLKWNEAEKSKIVPINILSFQNPEVLQIMSGDYESMINNTDAEMTVKKLMEKSPISKKAIDIINYRYGIPDGINHTLEETCKKWGVTRERIRQLEAKNLDIIRETAKNLKLI